MPNQSTTGSGAAPGKPPRGGIQGSPEDRLLRAQPADGTQSNGGQPQQPEADEAKVAEQEREASQKRPVFLTLIGIFVTVLAFFARREQRASGANRIAPYDIALLGLGSYRLARLTAFDQVTEPLRAPLTEKTPEGGSKPAGNRVQRTLGEMVSCPTCVGTWIAAVLTYALRVVPAPTRLFLAIMSASGIAEILHYAVSAVDAAGKAATKRAEGG